MSKKRYISVILSVCMIFCLFTPVQGAKEAVDTVIDENINIIIEDDFDKGIETWTKSSAKYFSGKTGKLEYKKIVESAFDDVIYNSQYSFANGNLNFDMTAEKNTEFSVMLRSDGKNYYSVNFNFSANKIRLVKKIGGKERLLKEATVKLDDKICYSVNVGLKGVNLSVTIDGQEYIVVSDKDLTEGFIGFTASKGQYAIDNLIVYENSKEEYEVSNNVEATTKIYVAPDGDDVKGDGSFENPYASIQKAKEMVSIAKGKFLPVEVIFKEGEYRIKENTYFTLSDSGTEFAPITYRADDGANVVFTGATVLDHTKFEPIKDENVKTKLYDHVQNKVLQLDLGAQGFKREDLDFVTFGKNPIANSSESYEKLNRIQFFLNDRVQTLSMWPNSGYEVIERGVQGSVDKKNFDEGGKIFFSNPEPLRWVDAKNAFVEGLLYYEWFYESIPIKEINLAEMSIDLARYSQYGIRDGHEYRVINLVEEIDMPGEWYVDFDTMILYYYPEKELTNDDVFEVSTLKECFISLDNVSYMNFKDIAFKNNKGRFDGGYILNYEGFKNFGGAIEFGNNSHDIVIDGCKFKDILGTTVKSIGFGNLGADMNIYIQNCDFYRGSNDAIRPAAGYARQLQYGNLNITNCFFYESEVNRSTTYDDGINIVNNLSVRAPRNAFNIKGVEFKIDNNEIIYGAYLDCDAGAIYVGRDLANSGSSISRNLIIDYGPDPEHPRSFPCGGIYLDDMSGGITMTQNIARARGKKIQSTAIIYGGGPDSKYIGNISLDATKGFIIQNRLASDKAYVTTAGGAIKGRLEDNYDGWAKKYPETVRFLDYLEDYKLYEANVEIRDNLSTNANEPMSRTNWETEPKMTGIVEDAIEINDLSIYVDPEKYDYRLKKEAVEKYNLPQTLPNEENLDLDSIGLQRELKYDENLINFDITYPRNKDVVPYANKVGISWQASDAACYYEYIIADDAEMKNIVLKGEALDPFVEVKELEANKTYYVKVVAHNTSRKFSYAIENLSGVIEFKTPSVFYSDTRLLEANVEALEAKKAMIKEGSEAGQYKEGTIALIGEMLEKANNVIVTKPKQTDVDEMNKEVVDFTNQLSSYANIGYDTLHISKRSNYELLTSENPELELTEGKLKLTSLKKDVMLTLSDTIPNYKAIKFKGNISVLKGKWHALSMRVADGTKMFYSQNAYSICIKEDVLELQRKGKILEKVPNEGIIKPGQDFEVTMACVTLKTGVNLYFEVDGKVIFDYLDTDTERVLHEGRFAAFINAATTLDIAGVSNIPSELFVPSEEILKQDVFGSTLTFDTTNANFTKNSGEWVETNYTNADGATEIVGTADAKASMLMKAKGDTTYIVSYWHHADPSYDNNVEVIVTGKDGEYRTKVDFTKGEDGYVELGSFKFTDNDASVGKVTVIFEGSGNGKVPVSSYTIREVDGSEYPDMLQKENQ